MRESKRRGATLRYAACLCGKRVSVRKDGTLRRHDRPDGISYCRRSHTLPVASR